MLLRTCQHRFGWPSVFAMLLLLLMPVLSQWHGAAAMPHAVGMEAHCAKDTGHCERPAPQLPSRRHGHEACGYCPLVAGLVPPAGAPWLPGVGTHVGNAAARAADLVHRSAPSTGLGSRGPPGLQAV